MTQMNQHRANHIKRQTYPKTHYPCIVCLQKHLAGLRMIEVEGAVGQRILVGDGDSFACSLDFR
jgi:hypothetical protein